VTKRTHSSSSIGGSSRKKARREIKAEVSLQRASQPGLSSAESEEEEEMAPLLIQSQHSRGPTTSEGIEVAGEPQSEAPLASWMTSGEGAETQPGSPSIMMPTLKVIECSPTTGPIGGKAPVAEVSLVQVLSSSFEGDDRDIGLEPTYHNASEPLHVVKKETQVIPPEIELLSEGITTAESIFSSLPIFL